MIPEHLTHEGLGYSRDEKVDITRLDFLREFIRSNWKKSDKINYERRSYNLKHIAEKCLDRYVSNGELIAAMILEGFRYKVYRLSEQEREYFYDTGHDAVFNVDENSVYDTLDTQTKLINSLYG